MNHKRIARSFLRWFETEANELSVSHPGGASSILWNPAGSYVVGYDGAHGHRSYQTFVMDIARARLKEEDAKEVLAEAINLVNA